MATSLSPASGLRPAALVFRYGGFSHINEQLLRELRLARPDLEFVDLDLEALAPPTRRSRLAAAASKALHYGSRRLAGRPVPADAGLKTPATFDRLGRIARRLAAAHLDRAVVSIQTQCLFDAKSEGVPHLIYTDHTHLANLGYPAFDRRDLAPRAWLARERAAFARADAVLVMSDHVRQSLLAQYRVSETRAHRVGVGMNTPDGPPPQRTEGRDPTALFVGVEWARKGGPELVAAIGAVRQRFPHLRLVVVGCEPPGLPDYCQVIGRVPLAAVRNHMAEADIFCFPTRIEPFGIVVLEAMATGLPVVAPRSGAFPDFIRHGWNGFLHEPLDVDSLTAAILQALEQARELPAIGQRARDAVIPDYTWPQVARRIGAIIESFSPPRA